MGRRVVLWRNWKIKLLIKFADEMIGRVLNCDKGKSLGQGNTDCLGNSPILCIYSQMYVGLNIRLTNSHCDALAKRPYVILRCMDTGIWSSGDIASLHGICEPIAGILYPFLVSVVRNRCCKIGEDSEKKYRNDQRCGKQTWH